MKPPLSRDKDQQGQGIRIMGKMDILLNDNVRKGGDDAREGSLAPPERPRTKRFWVALALLVAALGGAVGYGTHLLQRGHIPLSQVPEMLQSVVALKGRMDAVEASLRTWSINWNGLRDRVAKLERTTNANLRLARKHSEQLTAQLEERLQKRIDQRAYLEDKRLSRLETAQQSEHAQLVQLQRDLARAQQETAEVRQETGREMAGVHQQIATDEREASAVAQKLAQPQLDRVDFEVVRDRTYELARGISLHITGTDARYQRYKGWVSLAPEGRTLWVYGQGIDQPLVFYRPQDGERCELVVTRVARASATGYFSLPADQGQNAKSPVAALATAPAAAR